MSNGLGWKPCTPIGAVIEAIRKNIDLPWGNYRTVGGHQILHQTFAQTDIVLSFGLTTYKTISEGMATCYDEIMIYYDDGHIKIRSINTNHGGCYSAYSEHEYSAMLADPDLINKVSGKALVLLKNLLGKIT